MTWLYPTRLWLLLLIPLLVAYYLLVFNRNHATLRISTFGRLTSGGWRVRMRHLPFGMEMVAFALLIMALARPQNSNTIEQSNVEGIDIMLVLDASGSMMAMDLEPNRFEAAKAVATDFVMERPNDNIGLVVFAGESFTQCPLTIDHETLKERLGKVQMGVLDDGTAIGMGIATALNRLKESKTKSRIAVLLTDGTNNRGSISPSMAASIAQGLGIRVYTIGVGTLGEAPYPRQTAFGTVVDYVKADIDEASLKQIAQVTGAQYYRATDNETLREIYREIDRLEKSKLISRNIVAYQERFAPFLWVGLLLLFFSLVLRATLFRTNP